MLPVPPGKPSEEGTSGLGFLTSSLPGHPDSVPPLEMKGIKTDFNLRAGQGSELHPSATEIGSPHTPV